VPGLKKKPSTSELLDWLKLLMADDIPPEEVLKNKDAAKAIPPLYGALVKNEQDVHLFERLAFMRRRQSAGLSRAHRLLHRACAQRRSGVLREYLDPARSDEGGLGLSSVDELLLPVACDRW
jgi:hypothetical protein